ncbi:MAG: hypothetical protein WB643_06375 [Candidatus Bathyarchaeia archaeon]
MGGCNRPFVGKACAIILTTGLTLGDNIIVTRELFWRAALQEIYAIQAMPSLSDAIFQVKRRDKDFTEPCLVPFG